ncbi:MAG TPA: phosphatidylglycerol lysyltransferase domain-containing protein [Gaiellaceae bacterium]|nr:phosphatidylglycerol lysyltransferase domain-containing protein [Gaiellaceae bacterium]
MVRRAGAVPVAILTTLAATGWLYLMRPAIGGPRVANALPLDELSKHDAAPLAWYAVVWALAAMLIAAYARWARIERLTAALGLALIVGTLSYVANGVSIAIVQQISGHDAFDIASRIASTYLPATFVAVACALIAARPRRRETTFAVPAIVATGAVLHLLHAMLPGDSTGLVRSFIPDAVGPLARASGVLISVVLLVASRGLARRSHRAWQAAVTVSFASIVVHVLHGVNQGTLPSLAILVLLVARRGDFDAPGDVATRSIVVSRAIVSAATIVGYGVLALWFNRIDADQPFTIRFAFEEIVRGLLGLHFHGSPHLSDGFGHWYPLSLLMLGVAGTLWTLAAWVAPWRHRVRQEERERELARALVATWGVDTLAPFVLRADKSYFFDADGEAFIAYRVVGGVAIVSGDPIGPPERFEPLVDAFFRHAHARGWRVAILGVSGRWLPLYERRGLRALYHGDEAVVDTASFSIEGRAIRKVRQSVHRLERAGYVARVLRPSEIDAPLRDELERVARTWRGSQPERGFVMALDALFRLGDENALFVVGFAPDGSAAGFLHFALSPAANALSLSSMPRLPETPNGFNEWLIVETIAWAKEHGYEHVSLNFAPFAALLAPEVELSHLERVQRRALLSLKGHFQLDNLLAFNRKFFPRWERRFVVVERRRDLPRVGVAALAAEAYLPFQNARR